MSKSVREQVELFCRAHDRDPDDEWGDSGLLATTIIAANHELFASAEETVAELADLKARIEPVKHLFANAESKLDEFASLQQENARLRGVIEHLRQVLQTSACGCELTVELRAALSPQPVQGGGE